MRRPLPTLSAVLLCLTLASCREQGGVESGAFVVRLGTDTTSVESYTRTGERIDAVSVTRTPRTTRRHLTIWLAPDGSVSRYATGSDASDMAESVPPGGAIPLADGFYLPWDLALRRAASAGAAETTVPMLFGESELPVAMRREGGGWRFATQFDQPVEATLDAEGRLSSFAIVGGGATAERVATLDLDALASEFAARDAAGSGMGPLSPLDSIRVDAGGARVAVVYSRPSLRGRPLDVLVPPGQVWRMGANNATTFTTDREVRFESLTLPPGTYSLFVERAADAWSLIVNDQTGMSGLERDPARDLGRVPFRVGSDAEHADLFTIAIEPAAAGGVLRVRWGSVDLSAPFQVR